ncbi:MAG: MFS transporter [Desulfovibrionaceae bacterium]
MQDDRSRKMYLFLLVLTVAAYGAFQGWRTLFNNFAVEVVGLDGAQMGILQSVREVPGFLALLAVYVILFVSQHRLAALSVALMGLGVSLTGLLPSFAGLTFTVLLMSFGFHYFETMNQSLTLQYFGVREAPLVMGRLRSVGALTNLAVGGLVWLLAEFMGYSSMLGLMGALATVAGLWALTQDPTRQDLPVQHKKLIFRRRYWLFYALTFLSGGRRQIFVAFAVFLLVQRYGYTVQHITLLFILNNVVNFFLNPIIGRAVNRFGERAVLSLEYSSLLFVFTAYAVVDNGLVVGALYVLDNIFFNFAMAIRTYYQKIAEPGDMASGMAVGFTVNHIAAVIIPAVGGLVWMVDYRAVFLAAAGMSVCSLLLTQLIRVPRETVERD